MDLVSHHRRMMAWTVWADRETLGSLAAAGAPPPQAVRWMAHIIAAERIWLARIRSEPPPMAVWPDFDLERCRTEAAASEAAWKAHLSGLDGAGVAAAVTFTTTAGRTYTNTVDDILSHVAAHSAYHRGQIASALRAAGHAPALTDLIHAVRERLVV